MAYKNKDKEKQYKREHYHKNKKKIIASNAKRRDIHRRKLTKFINRVKKYKGCAICGYKKCVESLHFHHLYKKENGISVLRSNGRKIEDIKKEIRKCILVCANCHGEIHAGLISLE